VFAGNRPTDAKADTPVFGKPQVTVPEAGRPEPGVTVRGAAALTSAAAWMAPGPEGKPDTLPVCDLGFRGTSGQDRPNALENVLGTDSAQWQ
jgi:hypothetical protein